MKAPEKTKTYKVRIDSYLCPIFGQQRAYIVEIEATDCVDLYDKLAALAKDAEEVER